MKNTTKFCLIFSCVFGIQMTHAGEMQPFSLLRQNGTILEGYFSPPDNASSPIVFAMQGSSVESAFQWHADLSTHMNSLGLGLIVLEKQGISRDSVNLLEYSQTNCLENRLEDYAFCLKNMDIISPGWNGKVVFWGDSEGGMLAGKLAAQIPETAAVLLFATGGGMKPREEVKWTIRHRLEERGALQDEISEYMAFLDEQMDAMMLDPTPEKQFLGNTYKWWASFLAAEEVVKPLNQQSLPIYLVHGVEDNTIPVLSADCAAEGLKETNALTYLRLEGYGHDLDTADVQDAACRWLVSVLFGQEPSDGSLIAKATLSAPALVENSQAADMSSYVYSRGRDAGDRGGRGEMRAGVSGDRDTDGNERFSGDVRGSYDFGNGWRGEASAGGSLNKDREGNARGEVHGKAEISKDF
jgi:esterase/lipase